MKRVTAALLIRDGNILIAQRQPGDALAHKWEFPGGKIEPGETLERCLVREMMEEFGVEVEVHDFFCSTIYPYQHGAIELLAYRTAYRAGVVREPVLSGWAFLCPVIHVPTTWSGRNEDERMTELGDLRAMAVFLVPVANSKETTL